MPYQRRTRRRRRTPYSRSGAYLNTASKALSVAYAVKKLINVEYKQLRTNFTADPNSTGSVIGLTAIPQGDADTTRDGNKIRAKHLMISGVALINASAAETRIRYVVVRDNNGTTTRPVLTDVFSSANVMFNNGIKLSDPQKNSRFTVLWDKVLILSSTGGKEQVPFSYSMTLDHHIYFTGSSATDEGKGHLYLLEVSSEAANDPVISAAAVVKFIDN